MKDWKAIAEKLKEHIELLYNQIALMAGDLAITDEEQFGYKALSISQKITKLESELSELESQEVEEITDEDIYEYVNNIEYYQFDSFWDAVVFGAKAMHNGVIKKS